MKMQIIAIIDISGSMTSIEEATIKGFNTYLNEMKQCQNEVKLTLIMFNHEVKTIHNQVDIQSVPELTSESYKPYGRTALYDAMGIGITSLTPDEDSVVSVFITTDGYDNQSVIHSHKEISEMLQSRPNWNFIFAGVGINSFEDFNTGIHLSVTNDAEGQYNMYKTLSQIHTQMCTQVPENNDKE